MLELQVNLLRNHDNLVECTLNNIYCPNRWLLFRKIRDWDTELFSHSLRVAAYSRFLVQELFNEDEETESIVTAGAFFHDIGKTTWPNKFSHKELTERDREIVRCHPTTGTYIVEELWPNVPIEILTIIQEHHERPNGQGYPTGKKVTNPLSLIVSAADIFAALTEPRRYRKVVYNAEAAAQELVRQGYSTKVAEVLEKEYESMIV
ncbi:HD-GYP domain-containing protein [Heliorestis convoluta]|uniref:HD domain-containing protein n=1 Tax=Heliorestis convoluta TaxID=356322 RepID=A0A5Q2MY94_9FIRM|nr:HD domain-containing phosphohydrolase [Heliorestis convoluta]QGG46363.1 HD domain-containing protein [Heliorestis convoluta]